MKIGLDEELLKVMFGPGIEIEEDEENIKDIEDDIEEL